MPKTYTKQAESGEAGIALIHRLVNNMGFIWHPRQVDHGIDGEIELVDLAERRPLNRTIWVQSKVARRFPGENDERFHFVCDPADVAYWGEANVPVILVCSHPDSNEAWWLPVSELFGDAMTRARRRVDFDKRRDRFDLSAAAALLDLGVPKSDSLHVQSIPYPERLFSNLLRVKRLPRTIWAAPAIVSGNREARDLLRQRRMLSSDWMVLERTVYSFRRTDQEPLSHIADGVPEAIETAEWTESKSADTQRRLVRLLNFTLAEMHHETLRRHPKRRYLYFRPTDDLLPRRMSTGKSKSGRVVFQAYPTADYPDGAKHFRHHALEHRFVRLDGEWFLELSPTYHFTLDGYRDLPWGSEYVKGMKRRERNNAVRSLVEAWARLLSPDPNLFGDHERGPIQFGQLEVLEIDSGINDAAWDSEDGTAPENMSPLFDLES